MTEELLRAAEQLADDGEHFLAVVTTSEPEPDDCSDDNCAWDDFLSRWARYVEERETAHVRFAGAVNRFRKAQLRELSTRIYSRKAE